MRYAWLMVGSVVVVAGGLAGPLHDLVRSGQIGENAGNTGFDPRCKVPPTAPILWTDSNPNDWFFRQPVPLVNRIYGADLNSGLVALDRATGNSVWTFAPPGEVFTYAPACEMNGSGTVVYATGRLVQATTDLVVHAIRDAGVPVPLWSQTFPGHYINSDLTLSHGSLFFNGGVIASTRELICLQASDGSLRFRFDLQGQVSNLAKPAVHAAHKRVYVGSSAALFCINDAGQEVWRVSGNYGESVVLDEARNLLYTTHYHSGSTSLLCFDAGTGALRWDSRTVTSAPSMGLVSPVLANGVICAATREVLTGRLLISAFHPESGVLVWERPVPESPSSGSQHAVRGMVATANGLLWGKSEDHFSQPTYIWALDLSTGGRRRIEDIGPLGGNATGLSCDENGIYVQAAPSRLMRIGTP